MIPGRSENKHSNETTFETTSQSFFAGIIYRNQPIIVTIHFPMFTQSLNKLRPTTFDLGEHMQSNEALPSPRNGKLNCSPQLFEAYHGLPKP
jgi:hypothetical protein